MNKEFENLPLWKKGGRNKNWFFRCVNGEVLEIEIANHSAKDFKQLEKLNALDKFTDIRHLARKNGVIIRFNVSDLVGGYENA